MFNGIGLATPRGSGTNGYVVRNLAHIRPRDENYQRTADFDKEGPRLREPDQGILDHERKRKVEVKCLELQVELEDNGIPEEEIETQVSALREKLMANLSSIALPTGKALKQSDTHGIAVAKKAELSRMAQAFGTSANYKEGDSFNREKQEELKQQRAIERAENEKRREEQKQFKEEQEKAAKERFQEQERLRRRQEYLQRKEKDLKQREVDLDRRMPPPSAPNRDRNRGGGAGRSHRDGRSRSRSRSPPPARRRSPSPAYRRRSDLSPEPPARARSPRRPRDSRSRSPPPRRSDQMDESPPARRVTRDDSPPPRDRHQVRRGGRDYRDDSRSPPRRSYPSRRDSRSPSPKAGRRKPLDGRERSASRSPSRSPPRRAAGSRSPPPRRRADSRSRSISRSPPPRARSKSVESAMSMSSQGGD